MAPVRAVMRDVGDREEANRVCPVRLLFATPAMTPGPPVNEGGR